MVKIRKKFNKGFTLAEVLISMLLMSLFFMATTKVITNRPKPELQQYPHGYFECYYSEEGVLMQHKSQGSGVTEPQVAKDGLCDFKPPSDTVFTNIYYIRERDNEGSEDTEGDEDTEDEVEYDYFNKVEVQFNVRVLFTPGTIRRNYYPDEPPPIDDGESFKQYLNYSHPNSEILKAWNSGTNTQEAVLISW